MKGTVVGVKYGTYSVMADGALFMAPARGIFRKDKLQVMVGDEVELDENHLVISEVYPRKNELIRPLIANIDQALVTLSVKEPGFSPLLAFKYLTYTNIHDLSPYLLLTKVDEEADEAEAENIRRIFENSGVKTLLLSSREKKGLEEVKALFPHHITCLMGQSGVGKSSLLNAIDPSYQREVGEYSKALGRGKHQTKEVILLPYQNGFVADTPGFSSLDLNLSKSDLAKFFPGFTTYATHCYFSNCLHQNEKKCAVREALAKKEISSVAFECYQKLLNESEN